MNAVPQKLNNERNVQVTPNTC